MRNRLIKFTVSGGGTLLRFEEDIFSSIFRADDLMYQAKKRGKNLFVSDIS